MQSKTESFIEANTSTFIGFFLSWITMQFIVAPIWGYEMKGTDSFVITIVFTFMSIVRGYFVRRFFNWKHRLKNGITT